jgi:hypothetical protein
LTWSVIFALARFNQFGKALPQATWGGGVASATEIGGDVVAAGAAIAGLMLVYMGALSASFSRYRATEKRTVQRSFARRMWFAFGGLALNVAAIPFGLAAKGLDNFDLLHAALTLLALGGAAVLAAALFTALEIK